MGRDLVDLAVGAVCREPPVGEHLTDLDDAARRARTGRGRTPAQTPRVAAVRVSVGTRAAYPRPSASAPTGSSAGSAPTGPATVRFAGRPRPAYQRSTWSRAADTGSPGLPAVTTEFARCVKPREARSTQSPSRAVSIAGHAPTMTRWRSSTDSARCGAPRRDGLGESPWRRSPTGAGPAPRRAASRRRGCPRRRPRARPRHRSASPRRTGPGPPVGAARRPSTRPAGHDPARASTAPWPA